MKSSHVETTVNARPPNAQPPSASWKKMAVPEARVCTGMPAALERTFSMKIRYITIAEPSFRSASPSMTSASFSGAPSEFRAATTATGSVAVTIEPRQRAMSQSQSPCSASDP
jgi:hypothetical protein